MQILKNQWNFLPDVVSITYQQHSLQIKFLPHYLWSWVTANVLVCWSFELFTAILIHSTKLLEMQTTLNVQGYITAYSTWTKFESWASFSFSLVTSVSVPSGWYFKVRFSHLILCVAHCKMRCQHSKVEHRNDHLNTDQENSRDL
jgi:hypothetical protein